ncbi:MAG: N-acetyltransferase [Acidimicrobiales bacterium]
MAHQQRAEWSVRSAELSDHPAILGLVRRSFAGDGHDPEEEVDIVRRTWSSSATPDGLELVATDDGNRVVGHVLPALGELDGRPAMAIAPLCVEPDRQGRGVGSTLMQEALRRIEASGRPFVLLLGNPAYYARFGFEAAASHGIHYSPVGPDNPHFMVRTFGAKGRIEGGLFRYCWEMAGR